MGPTSKEDEEEAGDGDANLNQSRRIHSKF
jgi:hypothetical protein